jgi:hypothetical protein
MRKSGHDTRAKCGALNVSTPPETGAALAALYGATYQLEPARGHNVLLGEGARRIAEDVVTWVVGRLARLGPDSIKSTASTPPQMV